MFSFKSTTLLAALVVSAFALPAPDAGAQPFTKQNGEDAIALNNKFQSLTADSKCTSGDDACIKGQFAQCSDSKFQLTTCGSGTICTALPLVNKAGTAVTCTTQADKDARIAATGATGGGSGADAGSSSAAAASAAPSSAPAVLAAAAAAPTTSPAASPSASPAASSGAAPGAKSFTLQNGKDAQALNAKFAGLNANSPCQSGENACIKDQFAQCVNGKFVTTSCGTGLQCAALPLVLSAGTSITCTDLPQALQRIKDTGAGDTLTGN